MDKNILECGEVKTISGELIKFTCRPGEAAQVKDFFAKNVYSVGVPVTGRVFIRHGGLGRYTRFEVIQHECIADTAGDYYVEVLEIKDAPDGRWDIVIHECTGGHSVFSEWESVEDALCAFERCWKNPVSDGKDDNAKVLESPGFRRLVACDVLTPWFYAVGDQQIVGDFVFPEELQGDPVFCFGRQFLVFDYEGTGAVKTCLGSRLLLERDSLRYRYSFVMTYQHRLVYWEDGTVYDTWSSNKPPRPLEDDEEWIVEAIKKFRRLLSGKLTEFTVKLAEHGQFVGRLFQDGTFRGCAQGDYRCAIYFEEGEAQEKVYGFRPSPGVPDIFTYIKNFYREEGKEGKKIFRIEIKNFRPQKLGKKWAGVFHRK